MLSHPFTNSLHVADCIRIPRSIKLFDEQGTQINYISRILYANV